MIENLMSFQNMSLLFEKYGATADFFWKYRFQLLLSARIYYDNLLCVFILQNDRKKYKNDPTFTKTVPKNNIDQHNHQPQPAQYKPFISDFIILYCIFHSSSYFILNKTFRFPPIFFSFVYKIHSPCISF
jgi:hypothetical protein